MVITYDTTRTTGLSSRGSRAGGFTLGSSTEPFDVSYRGIGCGSE